VRPARLPARDPAAATAPRRRQADLHTRIRAGAEATGQVGQDRVAQDPVARADLVVTDRVVRDPAGQADLVVPVTTAPADPVARVAPECTDRADLVVPVTTDLVVPVGRAGPECTDPVALVTTAPVGPAVPGTATTSAVTSTEPPGATDLDPGVPARRHVPTGAGRFPRQEGVGTTDRSTITATTKTRCGTPGSTNGASTSSESGSRCKESTSRDARFADRRSGRCSMSAAFVTSPVMPRHYTPGMRNRVRPHRRRWVAAATLTVTFLLVGPAPLTHAAPLPPPQPPVQDIDGQENARNHRHQAPEPPPPLAETPPAAQP
jgi:hypothetical protein